MELQRAISNLDDAIQRTRPAIQKADPGAKTDIRTLT
jgi:hypothetical protein